MLYGESLEFPADHLVLDLPSTHETTSLSPLKKTKKGGSILPSHIMGMTAEDALRKYAVEGHEFQNRTLVEMFKAHGMANSGKNMAFKRAVSTVSSRGAAS